MRRLSVYLTALVLLACLSSCNRNVFYAEDRSVDEHGWLPTEDVVFDVEVPDTVTIYNFLMEVRNSVSYPYSNTFLFVTTTFPDGSLSRDTLEFPLADPSGRWMGKRTGRYVDTRYFFRRNARFPMEGRYRFAVTYDMRVSAVAGRKNIGLRIEYSNMK